MFLYNVGSFSKFISIHKLLMWMLGLYRNAGVNDAKAERAKIVEDFVQRKREAALNKHRGQADIFGVSGHILV